MSVLGIITFLANKIQLKKRMNWLKEEKKKKEFAIKYYKELAEKEEVNLDMIEMMIQETKDKFEKNKRII